MATRLKQFLRSFGPAIPSGPPREAVRAGLGALIGLGGAGLFLLAPGIDLRTGLYLIAPFGASSVLMFAVPNSPLAQPWSAMVGNVSAAVVGVAVCLSVPDPALRIALAVALAITVMTLLRAVHPPAGAVAMTAAMSPDTVHALGFRFALMPVAAGTAVLVAMAVVYARATGRRYPFRQFDEKGAHGTDDHAPPERLGLSEDELVGILGNYRQSLNLGVEDLARLIGAAEMQASSHHTGAMTAADVMSRNLVTVGAGTSLGTVADLFRQHGFTSLPVVGDGEAFLGVIFQLHLIRTARDGAFATGRGFAAAMAQVLGGGRGVAMVAADIMATATPTATPGTRVAALLPLMADGDCDAVPILEGRRIVGIVTRTDMIAALARQSLRAAGARGLGA